MDGSYDNGSDSGTFTKSEKQRPRRLDWCALVTIGLLATAMIVGCQGGGPAPGSDPSAHFHVREASGATAENPWVILLPGSSGLKIFEDEQHYFRAAQVLNDAGYDAIVVDYKPAYHASGDAPKGSTGEKIAWITGKAIEWGKQTGKIASGAPGALVVWSLGGEGLWRMLADEGFCSRHNVKAAAAYYPSNQDEQKLRTSVPLLILTGEADDVVEVADVKALVAQRDRAGGGEVALRTFPGAHHGFDISSLTKKRTMELIPLIGPRATFQYDAAAAGESEGRLREFLRANLMR